MQLWSGGHDARVCAMDDRCSVLYQVGTLKDNGDVAQAGGTKAIIRAGWNVWVFGMKGISIYSPHCVIDPLVRQVLAPPTPASRWHYLREPQCMHFHGSGKLYSYSLCVQLHQIQGSVAFIATDLPKPVTLRVCQQLSPMRTNNRSGQKMICVLRRYPEALVYRSRRCVA